MDDAGHVMATVCAALRRVRVDRVGELESVLVDAMARQLAAAGIPYRREVVLAPRSRIDLAVPTPDGRLVGVEAKKGRPRAASAAAQVSRYALTGRLAGVVFVAERAFDLPAEIDGVPVAVVSLHASMGIAL